MKIELGRIHKTKPYLLADTLEIQCFTSKELVSRTDAFTLIQNSTTPADEALDLDEDDEDDNNYSDQMGGVEITEAVQQNVDECFRQLEYRSIEFGEAYPFKINKETIELITNQSDLHKYYLFLLIASRIRTFKKITGFKNKVADHFEAISKDCLQQLMNDKSKVIMFGPNSEDRKNIFGTNLRNALPVLAKFMGMEMTNNWQNSVAAQGDAGIDLVGVQQLDDTELGWSVFLGQCAAHEEPDSWSKKRIEANITYYGYLFNFATPSQGVLFIPGCFRQSNGKWPSKRHAENIILMDRVRIMKLLKTDYPSMEVIKGFLDKNFT